MHASLLVYGAVTPGCRFQRVKPYNVAMQYAIQVQGHPGASDAGNVALQFIKAAVTRGHRMLIVFFLHDAVLYGSGDAGHDIPGCEWSRLAAEHQIDLVLCVSAVERRGMTVSGTAPLRPGFRLGGLGQWVDAVVRADRYLVFK